MQDLVGKHSGLNNNDFCCSMTVIQSSLTRVETEKLFKSIIYNISYNR